ncbi:YdcF family protein [Erysipelotrichaceae bacterium RD49]|nr:YdcF family protein [Erysipelotrichaceae bacterium RD49]
MLGEPRSLWSGTALFALIVGLGLTVLLLLILYGQYWTENTILSAILIILAVLFILFLAAFPFLLGGFLIVEGIRLIRREGFSYSNCLSLGLGILILLDILVFPLLVGSMLMRAAQTNVVFSTIYWFLSSTLTIMTSFFSAQLAIFCLSAWINLIHFRSKRNLDQIVVLGSGIIGTVVPPLLQGRIQKGIDLQHKNPNAVLILSGGQGPGEDIAEGMAMMSWAIDHGADPERTVAEVQSKNTRENLIFSRKLFKNPKGKTALVTTRYHVFRALLLSKELHMKAIGFGARTKWYFTLNALLREFVAYLSMTKKKQIKYLLILLSPAILIGLLLIVRNI